MYDILFFRGAWNPFLYGLDCQLPSEGCRVTEEAIPGPFSRDADLRALYQSGEILLSKDDGGCRVAVVTAAWDGESRAWNLWREAWGSPASGSPGASLVTGGMTEDMLSTDYHI